jgi:hypothetical protein
MSETTRKRKGFAVYVTSPAGDAYLRHGAVPGRGEIVRFRSRRDAQLAIASMSPGFDEEDVAVILPYPAVARPRGETP